MLKAAFSFALLGTACTQEQAPIDYKGSEFMVTTSRALDSSESRNLSGRFAALKEGYYAGRRRGCIRRCIGPAATVSVLSRNAQPDSNSPALLPQLAPCTSRNLHPRQQCRFPTAVSSSSQSGNVPINAVRLHLCTYCNAASYAAPPAT